MGSVDWGLARRFEGNGHRRPRVISFTILSHPHDKLSRACKVPMSAGRKHEGCWTCRLRHKKCDEARPSCAACVQRDLPCHGYGPRPAWFDGHDAERAELARIKAAVKRSLKRKTSDRLSLRQLTSAKEHTDSTSPVGLMSPIANPSPASTVPRKSSLGHVGERITSYREAELLMHYIDHVFPLQFRFYTGESISEPKVRTKGNRQTAR